MNVLVAPPRQAVVDAWTQAIEVEFGVGRHSATLHRAATTMAGSLECPANLTAAMIEFGYQSGSSNHPLEYTMRCLELLVAVADRGMADLLDTRRVAVLVAKGWNSGMLGRLQPSNEWLTPMPIFLHLIRQRYVSAGTRVERVGRQIVLVVVDLSDVIANPIANPIELRRSTDLAIATLRSVWSSAHPISQGSNGNLVVAVERTDSLHAAVADVRRMIVASGSPHAHHVRVWVEPLSDDGFHLESHLASVVGPIDAPVELIRCAG